MHFDIFVEDQSGGIAIEIILRKILKSPSGNHNFRINSYKGLGKIPGDLMPRHDPSKRILLDSLPRILRAAWKRHSADLDNYAMIIVVDLDDRDCVKFKKELLVVSNKIYSGIYPHPKVLFRIAIEEIESWLLGDTSAVQMAYPNAKTDVLSKYRQDSICGTWEVLADAILEGGATNLNKAGYISTGKAKCEWAKEISSHMNIDNNRSKSFQVFRDGIRQLAGI